MRAVHVLIAFTVLLAGCDSYPRDIEGTTKRVESEKVIRVGLVAGDVEQRNRRLIRLYLQRLASATGATPQIITGAQEPMLVRLEDGRLDLVIGVVAADSPWVADVALVEPLSEHDLAGRTVGLSPIARNGENRWIMLLEREARDLKASA